MIHGRSSSLSEAFWSSLDFKMMAGIFLLGVPLIAFLFYSVTLELVMVMPMEDQLEVSLRREGPLGLLLAELFLVKSRPWC